MHTVFRVFLLVICLAITVRCQGGRGGGGGGRGGGGGGGFRPHGGAGGSCKGDKCAPSWIIWVSVFGGIASIVLLICGIYYCAQRRKHRTVQPNVTFIRKDATERAEDEKSDHSMCKSGHWKSRYFQYGKWHGPHQFSLAFDSQSMEVTGSGSDDVGTFTVNGIYSLGTSRIGLTKKYQAGTGDCLENLGHQVTIQLIWNAQTNQFEGKWYVQTSKYHGEDKFELKFDGSDLLTVYEKV